MDFFKGVSEKWCNLVLINPLALSIYPEAVRI
jgi:hypothetical protein